MVMSTLAYAQEHLGMATPWVNPGQVHAVLHCLDPKTHPAGGQMTPTGRLALLRAVVTLGGTQGVNSLPLPRPLSALDTHGLAVSVCVCLCVCVCVRESVCVCARAHKQKIKKTNIVLRIGTPLAKSLRNWLA